MRLQGKVAVITGSGSGMGKASAVRFAEEGGKIIVADINSAGGEETVALIKKAGGDAKFVQTDVSKVSDLEKMIKTAVETFGRLDILYNHAGLPGPVGVEELDEKEWQNSIDINLKSGIFGVKYAIPEMKRSGGGSIIFTSSVSGLVGSPNSPTYSAAKGGIVIVTKSLALRFAPDNIRVNCICPGGIETPMRPLFMAKAADPAAADKMALSSTPLGRWGRPEEIANAALFLASDESSYITGVALPVDGGYTAR